MLQYTQFLIFELGSGCNLAKDHDKCPLSKRKKGIKKLDDETIINLAVISYKGFGFTGLIGWHFYNEPMLSWERMLDLIDRIREKVPESRFLLWTNGTILIDDKRFDNIESVVVTNYLRKQNKEYEKYYRNGLLVSIENFDNRLEYDGAGSNYPCLRPFVEFIINAYGEVHLCCQDWDNQIKIGNVFTSSLKELVDKKMEVSMSISKHISENQSVCYKCSGKLGLVAFDRKIFERTNKFLMSSISSYL